MYKPAREGRVLRLRVWGENACFTRPEMKAERVSYEVMTPSAARGILEAIFWKPSIRWQVTQIDVLKPISWVSVRRNEVGLAMSSHKQQLFIENQRQVRSGLFLRDVAYTIHARLLLTDHFGESVDGIIKFEEMFRRRAQKGQSFHHPYLGCREFSANFELIAYDKPLPKPIHQTCELGYMLHDVMFADQLAIPQFFEASLNDGRLKVPRMSDGKKYL
jgi:CRISPR-associated protein Cas5d